MRTLYFTLTVLPKKVEPKIEYVFNPIDKPIKNIEEKKYWPVTTTALGPFSPL